MDHGTLICLSVRNRGPTPIVVSTTGIDEDVTLFYERFARLSIMRKAIRLHTLTTVSRYDLNLPFLPLFDPFSADDLMIGFDVMQELVLIGDFF